MRSIKDAMPIAWGALKSSLQTVKMARAASGHKLELDALLYRQFLCQPLSGALTQMRGSGSRPPYVKMFRVQLLFPIVLMATALQVADAQMVGMHQPLTCMALVGNQLTCSGPACMACAVGCRVTIRAPAKVA